MGFKLRSGRGVAAVAGATLVLGGAGAAIGVAAGGGFGGEEGREAFADALSERVGADVTVEDIEAARVEAMTSRLDQAVADGQLTQEQADRMLERIQQSPEERRAEKEERRAAVAEPIAEALGVSVEELGDAKRDGTTLLELAQQNNVSRDDLETAVEEGLGAGAQASGRELPQGEELEERVDRIVESEGRPHGGRGPGGPGGPRGFFGGP